MAGLSAALLLSCLLASFLCIRKTMLLVTQSSAVSLVLSPMGKARLVDRLSERVGENPLIRKISGKSQELRHADELRRGMPEVLRLLCISLESGSSLIGAMRYAAQNCDEAIAIELRRTIWDLEAGQGFDEALEKLRGRTGGSEFSYLAVAMEIQHQSGGSLSDILESISKLLRQSLELKEELKTKTAQGRLSSRIVCIMPFALLIVISLFSPGYIMGFLGSALGICLLVLALLFETVGIILVRRASAIDFTVDIEGMA